MIYQSLTANYKSFMNEMSQIDKKDLQVPPRFELGSLDSESKVLTITPWDRNMEGVKFQRIKTWRPGESEGKSFLRDLLGRREQVSKILFPSKVPKMSLRMTHWARTLVGLPFTLSRSLLEPHDQMSLPKLITKIILQRKRWNFLLKNQKCFTESRSPAKRKKRGLVRDLNPGPLAP